MSRRRRRGVGGRVPGDATAPVAPATAGRVVGSTDWDELLLRRREPGWGGADEEDFQDRLARDPEGRRALVRHGLESMALRRALRSRPALPGRRRPRLRTATATAIAAAACLAAAGAAWSLLAGGAAGPRRIPDGGAVAAGAVRSPAGESWRFADGSRATLAPGFVGHAAFPAGGADLRIDAGRLDAEVVHGPPGRPWTVRAGTLAAAVVGTRFSARVADGRPLFALAEGRLALSDPRGDLGILEGGWIAAGDGTRRLRRWPAPVQDRLAAVIVADHDGWTDLLGAPGARPGVVGPGPRTGSLGRTATLRWGRMPIAAAGATVVVWCTPETLPEPSWLPLVRIGGPGGGEAALIALHRHPGVRPGMPLAAAVAITRTGVRIQVGDGAPVVQAFGTPLPDGAVVAEPFAYDGDRPPSVDWTVRLERMDVHGRSLEPGEIARILAAGAGPR